MFDPIQKTIDLNKKTQEQHEKIMAHSKELMHPTKEQRRQRSIISLKNGTVICAAGVVGLLCYRPLGFGLITAGVLQMGISGAVLSQSRSEKK